jgi:hypothetical protein
VVWQWQRNRDHRGRGSRSQVAPPAAPEQSPDVGPLSDPAFVAGLRPVPSVSSDAWSRRPAADLTGVSPEGSRLEVRLGDCGGQVLLAFLTTRCDGCDEFWAGMADTGAEGLPSSVSTVVVTRGPETVDRAEVARAASGTSGVPVVMSDQAWVDYQVMGYPFFILVDATERCVIGETVGFGWAEIVAMVRSSESERR